MAKAKRDVYQEVTNTIIAQLEAGTAPWQKSWSGNGGGFPQRVTGQDYRGINVLLLAMQGRSHPTWMTYKQAEALGGQVRKGEKSTAIVFFKPLKIERDNGDVDTIPLIRSYNVFNVEQIDGLPAKFDLEPVDPQNTEDRIEAADAYIKATDADISHGGDRAHYRPSTDSIQLPEFDAFDDAVSYYGTAAHELVHWTGDEKRCDRDLKNTNGTKDYAREELVAELGAAFIMGKLGLENTPRDDHAQYLASWLKVLKEDNRAIFKASTAAQKAVDFLNAFSETPEMEIAA
ncbi:zincin-like metallopeptidase domain-containing protein [bacterium]|nr:zincin-like metallopeptidase domain-containing protein [bacterium]